MTDDTAAVYEVCGMRMRSRMILPAPEARSAGSFDVEVAAGEPLEIPWERPTEDVVAELFDGSGWPRYSFCRRDDGSTRARFYSLSDFEISADGTSVVSHRDPAVDEGVVAILVAGSIASYLLSTVGHCVLHASAVEPAAGSAVAFVGPTTRGKTTTAALLCAQGLPLVTDDVLPVLLDGGAPRCGPGTGELRLRAQQVGLLDTFVRQPVTRETADLRVAVRPLAAPSVEPLLSAVVLPVPTRESATVEARRLSSMAAVDLLARSTRIEGWRDPQLLKQVFDQSVDLASRVPVLEVTIPWGPPFSPTVGSDLLDVLENAVES